MRTKNVAAFATDLTKNSNPSPSSSPSNASDMNLPAPKISERNMRRSFGSVLLEMAA